MVFSAGDADADAVTVAAVDANGDALVFDSSDATPIGEGTPGGYVFALPAQDEVARLTVTWSGEWNTVAGSLNDQVEIVGSYLFSIAQLRAFGDAALDDARYSDALLIAKRTDVTEFFEHVCSTSFITRYGRTEVDARTQTYDGRHQLWLAHKRVQRLIAVRVNGTALTEDELSDVALTDFGSVERRRSWGKRGDRIVVEYAYGHRHPPSKIVEAAMRAARLSVNEADLSSRMITRTDDVGTTRYAQPGRDYPTGIPSVDAVLERYDESVPLFA